MNGELIHRPPLSVRAPHDVADHAYTGLRGEEWRRVRHLDRVAALAEPLDGLPVTDYEHRLLEHIAGYDVDTVAVVVSLLWRARLAAPLDVEDVPALTAA